MTSELLLPEAASTRQVKDASDLFALARERVEEVHSLLSLRDMILKPPRPQ
jgi:hypothetical protein